MSLLLSKDQYLTPIIPTVIVGTTGLRNGQLSSNCNTPIATLAVEQEVLSATAMETHSNSLVNLKFDEEQRGSSISLENIINLCKEFEKGHKVCNTINVFIQNNNLLLSYTDVTTTICNQKRH